MLNHAPLQHILTRTRTSQLDCHACVDHGKTLYPSLRSFPIHNPVLLWYATPFLRWCHWLNFTAIVLVVNYVMQDGRSNWLEGFILICMFILHLTSRSRKNSYLTLSVRLVCSCCSDFLVLSWYVCTNFYWIFSDYIFAHTCRLGSFGRSQSVQLRRDYLWLFQALCSRRGSVVSKKIIHHTPLFCIPRTLIICLTHTT